MTGRTPVSVEYFSDLLCVWAYIAEARVQELLQNFGDDIQVQARYFGVFSDTGHKIGAGWADRGSWQGFAAHVHEVGERFGHVEIHPDLWIRIRPASSTAPHLLLKATRTLENAAAVAGGTTDKLAWALRLAFFRDGRDIGDWRTLQEIGAEAGLPDDALREELLCGRTYAALAADERARTDYRIEGSPTFVLNEGRQKLYGNVGYRILEANIREVLSEPGAGAASWC